MGYIKQHGTINGKIIVEKMKDGTYQIVDGHHRWLAAQKMGLKEVPIEVWKK